MCLTTLTPWLPCNLQKQYCRYSPCPWMSCSQTSSPTEASLMGASAADTRIWNANLIFTYFLYPKKPMAATYLTLASSIFAPRGSGRTINGVDKYLPTVHVPSPETLPKAMLPLRSLDCTVRSHRAMGDLAKELPGCRRL